DKGARVKVDRTFDDAREGDYDAVVLPGGVINGDAIRMLPAAREFVTAAVGAGKPIAAICHGGWLLVSAGLV
ncbi:DJ-1/PfpI family protein, partial [Escherichia coli]